MQSTPVLRGSAFQLVMVMALPPRRCQISWPRFAIAMPTVVLASSGSPSFSDTVEEEEEEDDAVVVVAALAFKLEVTKSSTEPDARLRLLMVR